MAIPQNEALKDWRNDNDTNLCSASRDFDGREIGCRRQNRQNPKIRSVRHDRNNYYQTR